MTLVLDTSVALAWSFGDEKTAAIDALIVRVMSDGAVVPSLWRYEMANGLMMGVRRKRCDEKHRDDILAYFAALDIQTDAESDAHIWAATLQLAALCDLTVYDASYLELAQRKRFPLATTDAALTRAAKQMGVALAL